MRSPSRVEELKKAADEVVTAALASSDARAGLELDQARTLVAAEIARSGHEAGVKLARRLAGGEHGRAGEKDTPEEPSTASTMPGTRSGGDTVPLEELLHSDVPAGLPTAVPPVAGVPEEHDASASADPATASASAAPLSAVAEEEDSAQQLRPPSPHPSVYSRHTEVSHSTVLGPHGSPVEETPPPAPWGDAHATEDQPLNEMARSIGVPRAGLPYMGPLLAAISRALTARGRTFTDKQKADLAQRLLANYPYLLGSKDVKNSSGLVVPIGSTEILITFDPEQPRRVVRNPAGSYAAPSEHGAPDGTFAAVDTINAAYGTGAHVETHGGQTGATRGRVAATFGIGATPGVLNVVRVGASISGTANQSNRSTSNIKDAERGKVEDNRIDAELIAYQQVNISIKIREQKEDEPVPRWSDLRPTPIRESGEEALLVWVPRPYTERAPVQRVTATGDAVDAKRESLPRNYYASGLTNIPELFDEILATLRGQGLQLPTGSVTREELLQKLSNLNAHLDDAVNEERGYQITLHDARGREIARVHVHSERLHEEETPQVGATSNKSHLEDVRTAIDGSSGSHSVTNSSTITPLSAGADLLPNPTGTRGAGLNVGASLSYTTTRTDTLSAGRTGLWVSVPRFTGRTAAYSVQFEHQATVSVLGGRRNARHRTTAQVRGRGLVRMPVKEAFAHGFAVDRAALAKKPPRGETTMPYEADAVLDSGRRVGDPQTLDVPVHVQEGKGIGMGLVRVADGTVDALRTMIEGEVNQYGFLPRDQDDPFASHDWYSHGSRLRRRLDNQDLLKKMISTQGLDSHYDQIHQDGMTFTLRLTSGTAGMDLDIDSVKVTVRARKSSTTPPRYRRTTNEYHTVNLAMGMDTTGQGTGRSRRLAAGLSLRGWSNDLKNAATSLEGQRTVGAADNVSFLNNRPELLEFPGPVDEFELTSDYEVTFEYKNSARVRPGTRPPAQTTNKLRKPQRNRRVPLNSQTAVVHLLRLGAADQRGPVREGTAPDDLLDQGLGYFIDTTGLRELAGRALTGLTGPVRAADSDIDTFAGTTAVRAHLREILKGEYTTDRLFETGLLRDTFGALNISGAMHDVQFSGSTGEKFVKGDIKLFLAENRLTDNDSLGFTWDQLDVAGGGHAGHAGLVGEADAGRHWQWNTSTSSGRTGGKELIQLDFNHAYAFTAKVHLTLSARQEKRSKIMPTGTPRHLTKEQLGPRTVMFLLSEPEALKRYAEGSVPISDAQLTDALTRWKDGKLTLSGDTVARVLTRWKDTLSAQLKELEGLAVWENDYQEALRHADVFADRLMWMHRTGQEPVRSAQVRRDFNTAFERPVPLEAPRDTFGTVDMSGSQDLLDYAKGTRSLSNQRLSEAMDAWRNGDLILSGDTVAELLWRWMTEQPVTPPEEDNRNDLVQLLYDLHSKGASPVWHEEARERFEALLTPEQRPLRRPRTPLDQIELPEYLRREDPGGRILGHSGVQTYRHNNGRTTYQLVREQIEAVAPGMLAAGADIWDREGRVVGRTQGGVDALQAMLAKGRDVGMFEEFLSTNGHSFYLVNPVGWLLTDVVEVNLSSVLKSAPEISEFVPNTGIEVYSHGYTSASTSKSKDGSQALTFAKLGTGGQQTTTASDSVAGKVAEGHHRGTTRAETGVTEQTVYDWSGHYLAGFDEEMTVRVRRLKMSGRPLNNLLLKTFDGLTHHGRTAQETFPGRLEIQVPRSIAEAGVLRGPSERPDLVPLPKLPGNAFIAGTLLDDALPIAQKVLAQVFEPGTVAKMFGAKAADPAKESSRSLPVLLSRLHLTNHLLEATGGRTYQVAKGIIMPGDSDVRADLYLKGDLYDLEVIAPMKEGTGTGRYNKHQSGTTTFSSTDQVRMEGDYQVDGSGRMGHHHADQPPHTWDVANSGNRVTSMNQNSADTRNYRREQHVKEQGPVFMVRLRFRGRLHADKFEHHLVRKPTFKGRFHSDPISGDVYAEMFEAEVGELRAQLEQARAEQVKQATATARRLRRSWPDMRGAATFDLAPLLADAAGNHLEANRAHQEVARHIRTRTGGDRPVVLTADDRTLAIARYRATLSWAVRTMEADHAAARTATGAAVAEPADLRTYVSRLDELRDWEEGLTARHPAQRIGPNGQPVTTPSLVTAMNRDVSDMIAAVQAARDAMNTAIGDATAPGEPPRSSLGVLPELPLEVSILAQDPVHIARDVAHDLAAHVRVDVRQDDGTVRHSWIDPEGVVHPFDPTQSRMFNGRLSVYDGRVWNWFTADLARRHGLLSDRHHMDAVAFALADAELARLYRESIAGRQTFEQAVAAEIAARRERLETLRADLPERHRTDLAAFGLEDAELDGLHRHSTARRRTFAQAVAAEIAARRERLEKLHVGLSERVRQAYEAQEFWLDDLEWRRAEERNTRREIDSLNATIAPLRERLAVLSDTPDDTTARTEIQDTLDKRESDLDGRTWWLGEISATRDVEERVNEARRILTLLREASRPGAPEPLTPDAVAREGARLDDLTSLVRLAQAPRVRMLYQAQPMGGTAELVEDELRLARPGTVALVGLAVAPGLLVAANHGGTVRWVDPRSGRPVNRPADVRAWLDLGLDGTRHDLTADLPPSRLDQAFLRRLRSSADAVVRSALTPAHVPQPAMVSERPPPVPENLALTDAHLSVGEDGSTVIHHRDEDDSYPGPTMPLADYAPVFWLTHDAPGEGVTVEDMVGADWVGVLDFLTVGGSLRERVSQTLGRRTDRVVETPDGLPDDLPDGTWVAFTGDPAIGAAVVLPGGRYRTYVPGREIQDLSPEGLRRTAGAGPAFVIARSAEPSLLVPTLPRSTSPREDTELDGTIATDEPTPPDPHLYRSGAHDHRVSGSGLAQEGWQHLGALSEFAPLSWLTHGGQTREVTASDVARDAAELRAAVRFFTHAEQAPKRADAVRTYLAERTGRRVEVTRDLPESLPPDTLVWFTGREGTGAARMGTNGVMRSFVPVGTTLRSNDGRDRLLGQSRTFVIAWPTVREPRTDVDAVSDPAPSTALPPGSDAERLTAARRSPATGRPSRPGSPRAFLGAPRAGDEHGVPDAAPRVPETAEPMLPRANTETDDLGLEWVRSPHSQDDCVEVAVVRR